MHNNAIFGFNYISFKFVPTRIFLPLLGGGKVHTTDKVPTLQISNKKSQSREKTVAQLLKSVHDPSGKSHHQRSHKQKHPENSKTSPNVAMIRLPKKRRVPVATTLFMKVKGPAVKVTVFSGSLERRKHRHLRPLLGGERLQR